MNEQTQIQASLWLMIAVRTIGAIDLPGHGPRKLPAPKAYVAIIVLWSIFGLLADMGLGKAAAMMSWIAVLVAAVGSATSTGPTAFATTLVNFLQGIAKNFGTAPPPTQGTTTV